MTERQYHTRLVTAHGERGFILLFEEGGELVEVPEAATTLFRTDEEAMAFAWELEFCVDEPDRPINDLSDDREALASAGIEEGE